MEPEFALRMEPTAVFVVAILIAASMEPEFALRMELARQSKAGHSRLLQWSRSLHSGWNKVIRNTLSLTSSFNGAGVCTPDGTRAPRDRPWHTACFNGAGVCTPDGTVPSK